MVNYERLYALRSHIEQLGFSVTITTPKVPIKDSSYAGFDVDGVYSYGCWRNDEQVAINQVTSKLADVYSALVYWQDKSK